MGELASHDINYADLTGPYPGLRAFRRSEAPIFFGRDEQIDGLLERLEAARLVVVAGESGCGKSSLVRAGLLPALDGGFLRNGGHTWLIAELRPGNRPLYNLAAALAASLQPYQRAELDADLLAPRLGRGPRGIAEILDDCPLPASTELLIVVDQFEELIRFRARTDPDEADAFVALLLETVANVDLAVRVVLTLRTDYLGSCAIFPGLPEALNGSQYLVPRLERDQLRDVIVNPARVFDGDVDPILANQLINEIGHNQDQLPVLGHALLSMWMRRYLRSTAQRLAGGAATGGRAIFLAANDYAAIGGLGETLSRHADEVYHGLDPDQQRIAGRLFCALWDEGGNGSDTRRPCTVREAASIAGVTTEALKPVADAFRGTEHSFLMPPADIPLGDDTVLDVGHESLFRHWRRLRDWVRQEADDAEHYRRWCGLALTWKHENGDLLSGRTLDLALAWRVSVKPNAAWASRYATRACEFADVERFLDESKAARSAHARQRRLARIGGIALGLTFVVAIARMLVSDAKVEVEHTRNAEMKEVARQQRYSAAAFGAAHAEPVHALQLALEAQGRGGSQVEAALRTALRSSRFRAVVHASHGVFNDARFLPDGERIVTVGEGDGLAVWDVRTGRRLQSFRGYRPEFLALDSRGRLAAIASDDGSTELWDLAAKQQLWIKREHVDAITAIAFSPDDAQFATASKDGTAIVWRTTDGQVLHTLVAHLGQVSGLAFSHDGKRIATSGVDRHIIVWDAGSGKKLREFQGGDDLAHLAFNTTGDLLAAASGSSVMLWDPITQQQKGSLRHSNSVTSVAFSPEGKRIATAGFDGTLRVWDARNRVERFQLWEEAALHRTGPTAADAPLQDNAAFRASWLQSVAFSTDGHQIVTTGLDGTAKVWNVDAGGELQAFRAHEQRIRDIAYSPAGDRIATGSNDGTVGLWDAAGHLVFRVTPGPPAEPVRAVQFAAGGAQLLAASGTDVAVLDTSGKPIAGARIAASSTVRDLAPYHHRDQLAIAADNKVAVWDVGQRRQLFEIDARTEVITVAVSPDDSLIASECRDRVPDEIYTDPARRICLWNATTGNRVAALGMPTATAKKGDKASAEPRGAHLLGILHLSFSADGSLLASTSSDKQIKLWDVRALRFKETLEGHRETVTGLAIASNGRMIASSGDDWIRLWNADTGATQEGFPDAEQPSDAVAFSPDGDALAAAGADGVVRIYATHAAPLRELARAGVPFRIPEEECRRYTQEPCHDTYTALQLTNQGREILRSASSELGTQYLRLATLLDAHSFAGEAARFAAADRLDRATHDAIDALTINWKMLQQANSAGDALRKTFAGEYTRAVQAMTSVTERVLTPLREASDGVVWAPSGLTPEIVASRVIAYALDIARLGGVLPMMRELLAAMPGVDPRSHWPDDAAVSMANAAHMRSIQKKLDAQQYKDAVRELDNLASDKRIPQALVLLRFIASSYNRAEQPKEVAAIAETIYDKVEDPDLLVELAIGCITGGKPRIAELALARALRLDPANDSALLMMGLQQSGIGRYGDAIAALRRVSPFSAYYQRAVHLSGDLAHDKVGKLDDAYHFMAFGAAQGSSDSWPDLAEAAWGAGRLLEARLIAHRVLEARTGDHALPDVELAMRFVLVAALCQGGEFAAAEAELDALIAAASQVKSRSWDYTGSRIAASRLADEQARRFVQALLGYAESRGKTGDRAALHRLLAEAEHARHP